MKKEIKGFIMGSVTTALLTTTVFTAFAQPISRTIEATYSNIKLYVDGKLTQPKDAQGNIVEPFTSNGTTYLPVRAIAQTLGKEVSWDGNTNSVYIGAKPASTTPNTQDSNAGAIQEVTVSTAEEFVKALGSNKKIIIKSGVYDLTSVNSVNPTDKNISWKDVNDGKELNFDGITNLTIEGEGSAKTELKVTPRYANIMAFNNCSNINIKNIYAGHTLAEYKCDAGVLYFKLCSNVSVSNSELYGCGSIGIGLNSTKNFNCDNTVINHCSLRAVYIYKSESVKFTKTNIVEHEAYSNIIDVNASKGVTFEDCLVSNNNNFGWSLIELNGNSDVNLNKCKVINNSCSKGKYSNGKVPMFQTLDYDGKNSGTVKVENTEITGNTCDILSDSEKNVTFESCKIENNSWQK